MTQPHAAESSYWFGRRDERLFLFDHTFQPDEEDDMFIWEIGPQQVRFFKRSIARATISKIAPDFDTAQAIATYESWRKCEGPKYLAEHAKLRGRVSTAAIQNRKRLLELRRETSKTAATFHRLLLSKLLKTYPGLEEPTDDLLNLRISVCWSCRKHVTSAFNPFCRRCAWLVCTCGACKCSKPD